MAESSVWSSWTMNGHRNTYPNALFTPNFMVAQARSQSCTETSPSWTPSVALSGLLFRTLFMTELHSLHTRQREQIFQIVVWLEKLFTTSGTWLNTSSVKQFPPLSILNPLEGKRVPNGGNLDYTALTMRQTPEHRSTYIPHTQTAGDFCTWLIMFLHGSCWIRLRGKKMFSAKQLNEVLEQQLKLLTSML